jgi:hypothetical protein
VSEACFLSEFAKFVRNGARKSQRDRAVSGRLPSKAIADHVNSAVGDGRRPNRQDGAAGAGKLARQQASCRALTGLWPIVPDDVSLFPVVAIPRHPAGPRYR